MHKDHIFFKNMKLAITKELARIAGKNIDSKPALQEVVHFLQTEGVLTDQFELLLRNLYTVCSLSLREREQIHRLREVEWARREGAGIVTILKSVKSKF